MTSQPSYENAFILRRPTVANFADIIKIPTIIKKTFKDSKKVKRIRNYMFKCNLYLYFVVRQKLLIFGEKILSVELKWCVTWFINFFGGLWVMHKCAKCHHCRISKTYFRERSLFGPPNLWAAPKKGPSSIRLKSHKSFQTTLCK